MAGLFVLFLIAYLVVGVVLAQPRRGVDEVLAVVLWPYIVYRYVYNGQAQAYWDQLWKNFQASLTREEEKPEVDQSEASRGMGMGLTPRWNTGTREEESESSPDPAVGHGGGSPGPQG